MNPDAQASNEAPPRVEDAEGQTSYEFRIDVDSETTHAWVVRLVGDDKRVLELGPAKGYMSQVLTAKGCTVTGIEIDPKMAAEASKYAERVIVGNLDELDLDQELGEQRFDVIVAADVLEHLKDPLSALVRLKAFLADGGHFVVSLPNIAHASVRLALMSGQFEYRDLGLLDRTHLRFFTHQSIEQLFADADLAIVEMKRQRAAIDASEVHFDQDVVPPQVIAALSEDPDATTYQFVLSAYPGADSGMRRLQRKVHEQEDELVAARRALGGTEDQQITEVLAKIAGREGELRAALLNAHDQLLRRDEEINKLAVQITELTERDLKRDAELDEVHKAFEEAREIIAEQEEIARRLRVRLERILASPPARLWSALGNFPGLRSIRARRSAGYSEAVGDRR